MNINSFPCEILAIILDDLLTEDLLVASFTCEYWRALAREIYPHIVEDIKITTPCESVLNWAIDNKMHVPLNTFIDIMWNQYESLRDKYIDKLYKIASNNNDLSECIHHINMKLLESGQQSVPTVDSWCIILLLLAHITDHSVWHVEMLGVLDIDVLNALLAEIGKPPITLQRLLGRSRVSDDSEEFTRKVYELLSKADISLITDTCDVNKALMLAIYYNDWELFARLGRLLNHDNARYYCVDMLDANGNISRLVSISRAIDHTECNCKMPTVDNIPECIQYTLKHNNDMLSYVLRSFGGDINVRRECASIFSHAYTRGKISNQIIMCAIMRDYHMIGIFIGAKIITELSHTEYAIPYLDALMKIYGDSYNEKCINYVSTVKAISHGLAEHLDEIHYSAYGAPITPLLITRLLTNNGSLLQRLGYFVQLDMPNDLHNYRGEIHAGDIVLALKFAIKKHKYHFINSLMRLAKKEDHPEIIRLLSHDKRRIVLRHQRI